MNVDFWFDPACPFCWVTSRWLERVAPHRDLAVTWRPISLFFKNDPEPGNQFYEPTLRTRDLLRVVESVRSKEGNEPIGALYTQMGVQIHNHERFDFDVASMLVDLGLDPTHAEALTDESWDEAIRDDMAEGLALTGDDVGTPLISVDGKSGRVALFGPVITLLPELDESLDLWDGFLKMVDTAGFFELKRTRTDQPTIPPVS